MDVTREFLHLIPSQASPQGSEPTQLGGVSFQVSIRDFSVATAVYITQTNYLEYNSSITEIL